MKRITIVGLFVGLLSLTMNAQFIQTSTTDSGVRTTDVENKSRADASIQDLLERYQNMGKQVGSVSQFFTKEEQIALRTYLAAQRLVKPTDVRGALNMDSERNVQLPSAYFNSTISAKGEVVEGRTINTAFDAQARIPFTATYGSSRANLAGDLLYDNGPYFNIVGPPKISQLQDLSLGMNTFGPACNVGGPYTIADDFVLPEDADISSMDFYGYQTGSVPPTINAVYVRIWNGDPSGVGTVVWGDLVTNLHSVTVASGAYRQLESAPGDTSRQIQMVTANTPGLSLNAGTYWVEYVFAGTGSSGPWAAPIVITGNATTGNAIQNNAGTWVPIVDVGPQGMPFQIYGTFNGGGSTFPAPYCGPIDYTSTVEPITLVEVAGISNRTSDVINGSPAHEDFTAIVGNMVEGETYTIALEGNTNGSWTCSFTVFIDWNQDGILDNAGERYEIGTITGSTGNDGQQAISTITVPAGVADGPTRMRVMKQFNAPYATDSCTGTNWGQAEDYTINITADGGGNDTACSQNNPENNFENGFTTSQDGTQIIATDINVQADIDFTLNTITVNIWGTPGSTVNSADIAFYENAGGLPGAVRSTQTAVVPVSQTVIGNSFGFDVSKVVFDIAPELLEGQEGTAKVYWVSLYVAMSSGSGYLSSTSVSIVGSPSAYSADGGANWNTNQGWDSVYTFEGSCVPIDGGGNPGPLTTIYGIDNANQDLIGFGTGAPQNAEIFGTSPITVNFENAGAIDPANPTTGYVLDDGGQFFSFDVTTGFYTSLGSIPGDWRGMEYDWNTGILYAINATQLYTIDPVGVSATPVGPLGLGSNALGISLAIDGAGVGYVHDIGDDVLYSVNLATGAATLIGSVGFDGNYGQGMCYDPTTDTVYMSAFNNVTFIAEWRSVNTTTGMSTFIGPITSVNDPAPQVAWSSVGETLNPPSCPKPTFLTVTDITETTAELSWSIEPNASNGYIWYVFEAGANPMTATPVATGTTPAGTTNATATGLENARTYDFYVVADCNADGLSAYAGPVPFTTLITPPACGGKFYDTGGPNGNYENNENVTTVISPDAPGDFVTVTFIIFNVEATWDALYVYDGPDASYPIISSGNPATNSGFPAGGYYGTNLPGPFSSTDPSGALTFVFRSEGSFNFAGWEADVTCAMYPPPNDKIENSINVGAIGFPYTDPAVRMPAATPENGNPGGCNLTGAYGVWYHFTTTGEGTANGNIVTPSGASNVSFYTAPGENAVETDLERVQQSSNPCSPGTSATINLVANQTYYVFVMNSGAVTDINIDATILGISDNSLEGFTYYPNPTNGILNLNSNATIEIVSIYNLLGQKVLDSSLNAASALLDISTLSSGTYVMKVTINGQTGTYKLLKQ